MGRAHWSFAGMHSQEHLHVFNISKETPTAFKKLKTRVLDPYHQKPEGCQRGESRNEASAAAIPKSKQYLAKVLETFSNMESITISFEKDKTSFMGQEVPFLE